MPQTELYRIAKKMNKHNPSFVPIPASVSEKRPLGNWSGTQYMLERDFSKREQWEPDCNLGLLVADDYVIIDIDNKPPVKRAKSTKYSEQTGMHDFAALIECNEALPTTLSVTTPSGGKHYYFKLVGREDEARLKNWTTCMSLNGKLVAVDIRKRGGYAMCPPSRKGPNRYTWDTADGYTVPMATMPHWILKNIIATSISAKAKKHFETQEYTSAPSENSKVSNDDVESFKRTSWWQPCFRVAKTGDQNNLHVITATEAYDCSICQRHHSNNSNHPFLVRNQGVLRFVCRPGRGNNVVIEQDSTKAWDAYEKGSVKQLIDSLDTTNRAVSQRLYEDLGTTVYPTSKPKRWLAFEEQTGIYREEYRDVIMRPFLDEYVKQAQALTAILARIIQEKRRGKADESAEIWQKKHQCACDLVYSLSMFKKKNDHLDSLFELVRDSRTEELFNTKKHLMHFTNGVYDFANATARKACCKDVSTMSTNQVLLPYDQHPQTKKNMLRDFFNDIMLGRADLVTYFLRTLSSVLSGDARDQQFYFLSGKGSNGKSTIVKLMRKALGDYGSAIASAQVSKPNLNAQAASPALMALRFKRAAFLTEMEEKVLHTEFLKMVAGGDSTTGRGLWQEQRDIELWVKIFIAVNDLPGIIDKTHGFWRKVVVIPFDAHFTQNPDTADPTQKPTKPGYEMQLLECADTLLAWLIDIYNTEYVKYGVKQDAQPEVVIDRTVAYQESQDIPLLFFRENIHATHASKDIITTRRVDELLAQFCKDKSYYKTPQLVKHVYECMDDKFPPSNARRQVWAGGKNTRAWVGCKAIDQDNIESDPHPNHESVSETVRSAWVAE